MNIVISEFDKSIIKSKGKNLTFTYGFCNSRFGIILLILQENKIVNLSFVSPSEEDYFTHFKNEWKNANFKNDDKITQNIIDKIFSEAETDETYELIISGSEFRKNIFRQLLKIPSGEIVSYGDVAEMYGDKKSVRAVASAVARNRIALLIPCHRVIRSSGETGEFRWGTGLKKELLIWEKEKLLK